MVDEELICDADVSAPTAPMPDKEHTVAVLKVSNIYIYIYIEREREIFELACDMFELLRA